MITDTTLIDTRKAVVGIILADGANRAMFSFPDGKPSYSTLQIIVALMADGYKMDKAETVPIHQLPK